MKDHETIALHWANRLSFISRRVLADGFRDAGHHITAEEWAVLLLLWQSDGRTPGDIAALTVRDKTTVTRLVDGMVKKSMVTRGEDPKDRRRSRIHLTQQGENLQGQLVPIAQGMIDRARAGLSSRDVETTVHVLRAMAQNLAESTDNDRI